MLAIILALTSLASPPPPAGIHVQGCDEPGSFFFEGGLVIEQITGCGPAYVLSGRWRRDGDDIAVRWERRWSTRGVGPARGIADCGPYYDDYEAQVQPVPNSGPEQRFGPLAFEPATPDECGGAVPHSRPPDPHAFLRRFDGQHPETFSRVLGAEDLKGMPLKELRLMRNEIFARYGLRFRDPELRAHFEKLLGHGAVMVNVDAFLSETEKKNVEVLAAAEKAAQQHVELLQKPGARRDGQ